MKTLPQRSQWKKCVVSPQKLLQFEVKRLKEINLRILSFGVTVAPPKHVVQTTVAEVYAVTMELLHEPITGYFFH